MNEPEERWEEGEEEEETAHPPEVLTLVRAIRELHPESGEEPGCLHECLECSAIDIGGCEDRLKRAMKPFKGLK